MASIARRKASTLTANFFRIEAFSPVDVSLMPTLLFQLGSDHRHPRANYSPALTQAISANIIRCRLQILHARFSAQPRVELLFREQHRHAVMYFRDKGIRLSDNHGAGFERLPGLF